MTTTAQKTTAEPRYEMRCDTCSSANLIVTDSRPSKYGRRRRRTCQNCGAKMISYEMTEANIQTFLAQKLHECDAILQQLLQDIVLKVVPPELEEPAVVRGRLLDNRWHFSEAERKELKREIAFWHRQGFHDNEIARRIGKLSTGRRVNSGQVAKHREELGLLPHEAPRSDQLKKAWLVRKNKREHHNSHAP